MSYKETTRMLKSQSEWPICYARGLKSGVFPCKYLQIVSFEKLCILHSHPPSKPHAKSGLSK